MRADLQRYYGIDVGRLGNGLSAIHAAACYACLPMGSTALAARVPEMGLSTEGHLLYAILDCLIGKRYPRYWDEQSRDDGLPDLGALPVDEMEEWYSKTFKEVDGCQIL